jgi:hypothetical protein
MTQQQIVLKGIITFPKFLQQIHQIYKRGNARTYPKFSDS